MEVKKQMYGITLPIAGVIILASAFFAPAVLAQPELTATDEDTTVTATEDEVKIDKEENKKDYKVTKNTDWKVNGSTEETDFTVAGLHLMAGMSPLVADDSGSDVFAFGQTVTVVDAVMGDLFSAANAVTIEGPVAGSARIAGNYIEIDDNVGRNVVALGNSIRLTENGMVGGHMNAAGATIQIDGEVMGKLAISGDTVFLNGTFNDEISIEANSVVIGDNAVFMGEAEVKGPNAPQISKVAEGGDMVTYTYQEFDQSEKGTYTKKYDSAFFNPGARMGRWLMSFLFFGIIGLLSILVAPKWMTKVTDVMTEHAGMSWMKGALLFFVAPIVGVILMMTLIGIPLSLMLMFAYWLLLLFGRIVAGYMLGRLILSRDKVEDERSYMLLSFVIGFAILSILYYIPVIGGLIGLLAAIWGVGAITHYCCMKLAEKKAKKAKANKKGGTAKKKK
ncbi:MAG: hypothetical protein ABIG66_02355 [Candidatus Kerfeldbacteria bacterium]